MSASKKKRMGSQRRPLNPSSKESPETSDTAKSPPVAQGRQRADARADVSPNSAQAEVPARKKLSGNKEKLHFKDVNIESGHKPLEEAEGTVAYSHDQDTLGFKHESIDESLEMHSSLGSVPSDFDLLLNESLNVSAPATTEAILSTPQTSDFLDTEPGSDLLLKGAGAEGGVLSQMDLAQQMPDILEAALPAGVTGESTCPVRIIEHEEIDITGSPERTDEAGHTEKPVSQQSDERSRPTAKIRKLGASRRKKDTNITGLEDHEAVVERNVAETTDFTIVQNTVVTVDSSPDNILSEGQLEIDQTDTDYLSVDRTNQSKDKEESHVGDLLTEFKDQEVEETKPIDHEKVVDLEIFPVYDTIAAQSSSHPGDSVCAGEVEEVNPLEIGDSSKQQVWDKTFALAENITIENFGLFDNDFVTTEEKEEVDKEFKEETFIGSYVSSETPFELERETSSITEFTVTKDDSDFGEPLFRTQIGIPSSTKTEDKNEMFAAQTEDVRQITDEGRDGVSVDLTITKDNNSDDEKINPIEQQLETIETFTDEVTILPEDTSLDDVHDVDQTASSFVNVTHEGADDDSESFTGQGKNTDQLLFIATNGEENESNESGSINDDVLLEQQPEPLTLSTDPGPGDQLVNLQSESSEPQEPQIQRIDDTEEESDEILTPIVVAEETQFEPVLHKADHADKVEKGLSQLVYDESRETAEETSIEAIFSSENPLQMNIKEEILQLEPPGIDFSKVGEGFEEEELSVPKEEYVQIRELDLEKVHTDTNAPLASVHPDVSADEENVTVVGSQRVGHRRKLGSSRRAKERRHDDMESEKEETDIPPNERIEITQDESTDEKQIQEMTNATVEQTLGKELDESYIKVHGEDSLFGEELPTELQKTEVETEIHALKESVNVHQLTYISDNETREEMDKQPDQGETTGEPSEAVPLVDVTDLNEPNADLVHGPRRKLGSSRRAKALKPELTTANYELSNESEVSEFVQLTPAENLLQEEPNSPNFASEVEATQQDTPFLLSHQELTVNSELKEKENKSIMEEIVEGDADVLQDKGTEETTKAEMEDTVQPVVISAEEIPKDQLDVQDIMMGSTRRLQYDEKWLTEDIAAISDSTTAINEKKIMATMNEASDHVVKQEETDMAAAEKQVVEQEDKKEEVLETVALIEVTNTWATMQNLQPTISEAIQPSSPGKRRKMGSTRRNLTPAKESPLEETVTPINVGKDNESKEHSGLPAASVQQQPPPDEETPLSPRDNKERLRSESGVSSEHVDLMTEDAGLARRRKMGSHRKSHTDQSIRQERNNEENLLHSMEKQRAESPKLGFKSEFDERDGKGFSTASAFSFKGESRSVGQKMPQQLRHPSLNVRQVQQSNIRLAAGYDLSASKYEVVMIGDSSVGKTSFMQRAQSGKFAPDVPASIGMDSYKWSVVVEEQTVVLHLWDTAGQERFHSMTKQIFHRAQAFLLMYDVTCAETFTAVSYWANCIKEGARENVVILLLGNKCDSKERKVRREEGQLLAQENDFAFIECSAATGENVLEALETVARLLSQTTARREEPLVLRKPEPRNKGCC